MGGCAGTHSCAGRGGCGHIGGWAGTGILEEGHAEWEVEDGTVGEADQQWQGPRNLPKCNQMCSLSHNYFNDLKKGTCLPA